MEMHYKVVISDVHIGIMNIRYLGEDALVLFTDRFKMDAQTDTLVKNLIKNFL